MSRAISLNRAQGGDATTNDDRANLILWNALAARDARTDPEARLLASEQLRSVVQALPALTASDRVALSGTLNGYDYEQLAPVLGGTAKAAEHAAFRARRKLAAALPRAA